MPALDAFLARVGRLHEADFDPAQLDPAPDCLASYLLARREQDEFSGLPKGTSNADPHGPL